MRNAVLHNEAPWPASWDLAALCKQNNWIPLLALQNIMGTTTNMVFTRALHEEIGGFRDYRYCHDWDFALRAALHGRIRYMRTMLGFYRLHASNTIKESSDRVQLEVRRMFASVLAEAPDTADRLSLRANMAGNHYLAPQPAPALAIIIPDRLASGLLQREAEDARLPVAVVTKEADVPEEATYLYQPGVEAAAVLRLNHMRGILLAIAVRGYDRLLLSRSAEPAPTLGADSIDSATVLRRGAAGRASKTTRLVRLYPPIADAAVCSAGMLADQAQGPGGLNQWARPARVPMPSPLLETDMRPVVFILPAFLAVGGAERLVLETMRHLQDCWRFVVVTTEPLRPEQGSTHAEALTFAPVYDLAELVTVVDRIRALELLRDWHGPALVWITNGSPWQTTHAAELRRVFAGIPIVDHQAYDHEAGWIGHFGDPGVQAANRFVAINQKIQRVMQERFHIPAHRIDLIYHGTDTKRICRRQVSPMMVAAHRERFGLPADKPVFGMIGRLTAQKRPFDLIQLAHMIGPGATFAWIGLGELEPEFMEKAAGVENVKLIPAQPDLRPVYEMLDGLVVTSEFEGLPIVLIEALLMGVPVLSTDVGAIKEVLDKYGSGTTFAPPGDIPALVRAFKAFRKALPRYRAAAAAQSARVAEDFSSARMARDYAACFRQAIDELRLAGDEQTSAAALPLPETVA